MQSELETKSSTRLASDRTRDPAGDRARNQTDERVGDPTGVHVRDHYSLGYIPALDGLRAISILLVLAFHDIGPVSSSWGHAYNGWVGVDVFFVISGYLITSILLKEAKHNNGDFSLKKFYMRRWLRIAPVYYTFLAVVLGWHLWGGDHHWKPFVAAAFYLTNIDLAFGLNLIPLKLGISHLWSLAVEEQFYLIFPACLKFLKKHALPFVSTVIAVVYCWRLYLISHGADWLRIVHGFDTKIDTIMFGVLLALLLSKEKFRSVAGKLLGNGFVQAALLAGCFTCFRMLGHPGDGNQSAQLFFWGAKLPLTTLAITGLLCSVICNPKALVAGLIANPVFVFIGKLSYSLYLWHPLVHSIYCGFYWDFFSKHGPQAELIQYFLILVCACLSYYVIERPFLKLKGRFS